MTNRPGSSRGEDAGATLDKVFRSGSLLPILWIAFLLYCNVRLNQNNAAFAIAVGVCFLIYPWFWERREREGKSGYWRERMIAAAIYTALIVRLVVIYPDGFGGIPYSAAKTAVASNLRDPGSADFRNMLGSASAVCGEVNGKNAFGAFAGFKRFVFADQVVTFEPEIPVGGDVSSMTAYYQASATFSRTSQRCYQ